MRENSKLQNCTVTAIRFSTKSDFMHNCERFAYSWFKNFYVTEADINDQLVTNGCI